MGWQDTITTVPHGAETTEAAPTAPTPGTASWRDTIQTAPPEDSYLKGVGKAAINSLPYVGMTIGGLAAAPETAGLGSIPAGAAGYGLGAGLRDLINQTAGIQPTPNVSIAQNLANKVPQYATEGALNEMGGQVAGAAIPAVIGGAAQLAAKIPGVQEAAEYALPGVTEKLGTSFKAGQAGINFKNPAHVQGLYNESAEAAQGLAEPVGNIQQIGKAEFQQVSEQEAGRQAAEEAAAADAKAYNAERQAAAKSEQAAAQKEAEATQQAQRTALENEVKGKVEAQKPNEVAARQQAAEQAQQATIGGGKQLAQQVETARQSAGKAIENAYTAADKADFRYQASNGIANLKNTLDQLAVNDPLNGPTLSKISTNLDQFNNNQGIASDGLRGLKKTLSGTIESLDGSPAIQAKIVQAYQDLNTDIGQQLTAAGLPTVASNLTKANTQYSAALLAQQQVGKVSNMAGVEGIPAKAINLVESLGNGVEGSSAINAQNQKVFSYIKQAAPDVADALQAKLVDIAKTRDLTKANISDSQINKWFSDTLKQQLDALPPQQPVMANVSQPSLMNVPAVNPANPEAAISQNPGLAPTLPLANRLTQSLGEQSPLTQLAPNATPEYQLGGNLKRLIAAKAQGPVAEPELVQAGKVLQENVPGSKELLNRAVESQKLANLSSEAGKVKFNPLNPIKAGEDYAAQAANQIGYKTSGPATAASFARNDSLGSAVTYNNLSSALGNASSDSLLGAGNSLLRSDDPMHQMFGRMLNSAGNSTGITKASTLYILSQNPAFRTLMAPDEVAAQRQIVNPKEKY